ncbi:MAG: hypothetical protein H6509_16025 [Bryobacterales bacterium]|nr:hypothetical protein [Bryobacterales bacterium]
MLLKRTALLGIACLSVLVGQTDSDPAADRAWMPGGTPEEQTWAVVALFGTGDNGVGAWDGQAEIADGEIFDLAGYRFEPPDRVLPAGGWRATVKADRIETGVINDFVGGSAVQTVVMPKGVLLRGSGSAATRLTLTTPRGRVELRPMQLAFGEWQSALGGAVRYQRTPAATDLSGTEMRQHDFPSLAPSPDGSLTAVWMSYHDRREELNMRRRLADGRWTRLIPVARSEEDLWRPHATTDAEGKPWLIWSHRPTSDGPGNWDLYAMPWEGDAWGERVRLSRNPLPDIEPAVARAADGTVYVVWQSMVGRYSQIRLRYLREGRWSEELAVTESPSNNWEPAVATGPDGAAWIAWDRYEESYDVRLRRFAPDRGFGPEKEVISTPRFEAHVSVAVDEQNRPWVAWETDAVNWGKDYGFFLGERSIGAPLAGVRETEIAVLDGEEWKTAAPLRFTDPLEPGTSAHSRPLLSFDPDGNLWLAFKRRYARRGFRNGVHWEYFLTRLDGDKWADPILLPQSGNRKSTRMSLAAAQGRLWAFWPHDNREWAFGSQPHNTRVAAGSLPLTGRGRPPVLRAFAAPAVEAKATHPNEVGDVRTIRNHRVEVHGQTMRILRGDLHRHTELSPDQGGLPDGSLPEFYRYMIDAADMDYGASTDHQAGGNDFWNFMTQKMADMYHFPDRFATLYAYERNPGNPHGHRNLLFTHRDYPVTPFFQAIDEKFLLPDTPDGELLTFNSNSFGGTIRNDTTLLHEVVKANEGLAIPHTSGSSAMGTDWHAYDPEVDAVVEIYQGDRINSEHEGAPRWKGPDGKQPGGWQAPGAVWNAWKKGYKLGVIASSDHMSTHISYAMVYAPENGRHEVWDSIKARRTYGATDNIVLEFWVGDCFMGEDCATPGRTPLRVRARGTGPIAAIHVIRDGEYIYKAEPGAQQAEFEFTDAETTAGAHWYYVRVEQQDEELAWSSPIWVDWK